MLHFATLKMWKKKVLNQNLAFTQCQNDSESISMDSMSLQLSVTNGVRGYKLNYELRIM